MVVRLRRANCRKRSARSRIHGEDARARSSDQHEVVLEQRQRQLRHAVSADPERR